MDLSFCRHLCDSHLFQRSSHHVTGDRYKAHIREVRSLNVSE